MTQVNTGIPYELFVKRVYEALQRTKDLPHHHIIDIRHNVKMVDQGGIERQFDLYWEREEFGNKKKSMIECKDYQNGVSIERVDALIGKMCDFPDITPILATSVKYQSGALQKAKNHHIEIMVVREEDLEKDWKDENGTPLIRSIEGNIIALEPVRIHGYTAFIDKEAAKELGISGGRVCARNDKLFFGDVKTGWRTSLLNLGDEIEKELKGYVTEPQTYRRMLNDGYEEYEGRRVPIKGFEVQYTYLPPHVTHTKVEPIVEAVFEYVLLGQKEILMRFGSQEVVKQMPMKTPKCGLANSPKSKAVVNTDETRGE